MTVPSYDRCYLSEGASLCANTTLFGKASGDHAGRALLQKDTSQALTCTWALGDHGLSSLQPAPLCEHMEHLAQGWGHAQDLINTR